MSADQPARFRTTAWSMVRNAQDRASPEHVVAVNRFVSIYWKPVFYFLRVKGYDHARAEDLTQEFFLQFLKRNWISRADPERGRFRTFLITILVRFLADQGGKRAPKQRQFDEHLVPISTLIGDSERTYDPPATETPEDVFMRQWARAVIESVCQQVRSWCEAKGRSDWFGYFEAVNFPAKEERAATQQGLAEAFRVSRDQVRFGLQKTEAKFAELLRGEIAKQVTSDQDIDTEIRELEELLEH